MCAYKSYIPIERQTDRQTDKMETIDKNDYYVQEIGLQEMLMFDS